MMLETQVVEELVVWEEKRMDRIQELLLIWRRVEKSVETVLVAAS